MCPTNKETKNSHQVIYFFWEEKQFPGAVKNKAAWLKALQKLNIWHAVVQHALEAVQIKGFLKNINIKEMLEEPLKIMCDRQDAICTSKIGELNTRDKHIARHYYYILIW